MKSSSLLALIDGASYQETAAGATGHKEVFISLY
jgi:hypothetical protein